MFAPSIKQNSSSKDVEAGRSSSSQHAQQFARGFSDAEIRSNFIQKVYAILAVMMGVTVFITATFMYFDKLGDFLRYAPYHWPMWVALIVFLVVEFTLICCEGPRRCFPCNFILLAILTLAQSMIVACATVMYSVDAVMMAMGLTLVVCLTVSLFAYFTSFDFTRCWMWLMIAGIILLIIMVIALFVHNRILQLVYASLGVLLGILFLAFDTQLIMGGRRYELSPEEYIFGALILYIDMIQIFLFILSFFRTGR